MLIYFYRTYYCHLIPQSVLHATPGWTDELGKQDRKNVEISRNIKVYILKRIGKENQ